MNVTYVCADPGIPLDGTKGASVHVRQTLGALKSRGVSVRVLAARPAKGASRDEKTFAIAGHDGPAPEDQRALDPSIVEFARGSQLVYERYALWSDVGVRLAAALDVPLVVEVNAPLPEEASRWRGLEDVEAARELERRIMRGADAVLCVSTALSERVTTLRGRSEGVFLVPNAVDVNLFAPALARETEIVESAPRIVFVGSLKPWHGVTILIDALARLRTRRPGVTLRIAGDGPERPRIEAHVAARGLSDSVVIEGALVHERIPALLREADVAAAPYPPLEGFWFSPLKVGEYLACGVPVVASNIGDIGRLLEHEHTALLVPPGDVAALSMALDRVCSDRVLRRHLAVEGRRLSVRTLSLDVAASRLMSLLGDLTRTHAGAGEPS